MITLLIATRNRHKVEEIRAILGEAFEYRTLNDLPESPKVIEDAATFAGNATKKALELAKWIATMASKPSWAKPSTKSENLRPKSAGAGTDHPVSLCFVLADDSGLEVDCLKGAPGVHSARFAALDSAVAENSSSEANNAKLLRLLSGIPAEKRTARFRCVLALAPAGERTTENASPVCYADEAELRTELFEGACEGQIGFSARGTGGFGYDPLFIPSGHDQTFAELGAAEKNRLSHRARALAGLAQRLTVLAREQSEPTDRMQCRSAPVSGAETFRASKPSKMAAPE